MLSNRYKNLSSQMTTLLSTMELILKVNSRSTILSEQLSELKNSRETTMASIAVCNDRAEVVNVWCLCALLGCHLATKIPLLAIVHVLRLG
jgi:hypothetical protein